MRKIKLYEFQDGLFQFFIYIILFLEVIGLVMYVFVNSLLGYIFMGMPILIAVCFFVPVILVGDCVCLDEESVSLKKSLIFNYEMRKEKWADLQSVEIKKLSGIDERKTKIFHSYFCLFFNDCNLETHWLRNFKAMKLEQGVIIILDTKRNRRILREYLPEQFKHVLD